MQPQARAGVFSRARPTLPAWTPSIARQRRCIWQRSTYRCGWPGIVGHAIMPLAWAQFRPPVAAAVVCNTCVKISRDLATLIKLDTVHTRYACCNQVRQWPCGPPFARSSWHSNSCTCACPASPVRARRGTPCRPPSAACSAPRAAMLSPQAFCRTRSTCSREAARWSSTRRPCGAPTPFHGHRSSLRGTGRTGSACHSTGSAASGASAGSVCTCRGEAAAAQPRAWRSPPVDFFLAPRSRRARLDTWPAVCCAVVARGS